MGDKSGRRAALVGERSGMRERPLGSDFVTANKGVVMNARSGREESTL